jgi:hypothetical protein
VNNRSIRFVEPERWAEDPDRVRDWSAEDQETARVAVLAVEVRPDGGTALVVLVVAASSSFNECTINTANITADCTRLGRANIPSRRRLASRLHDASITKRHFGSYLFR